MVQPAIMPFYARDAFAPLNRGGGAVSRFGKEKARHPGDDGPWDQYR